MAKVRGLQKVLRELEGKRRDIIRATGKAVEEVGDDLLRRSKQLAPVDTGDLRGSGVNVVLYRKKFVKANVSFNKSYAMRQHENLTYNHPQGGQAKYLMQPMNEQEGRYRQYIKEKLRRVIR